MDKAIAKRFKRVYIEIGNVCNLQCSFCPEVERKADVMELSFFKKILAEVRLFTEAVCLHLMGEPLNHPHFGQVIEICQAASVPVELTTNGTLLNEERSLALLNPIVRQVNFSIQSYASNFPGKDIRPYLAKILEFVATVFEKRPDLYINLRLWNLASNDEHLNKQVFAAVEEFFGTACEPNIDITQKKNMRIKNRLFLHFDSRFVWPNTKMPFRSKLGTCHGLSSHIGIHSDGTVVPCCLDKEAVINLGDLNRMSLGEIISSKRASQILDGFKRGELVEDLCQKCQFISRFDRKAMRARRGHDGHRRDH